MTGEELARIINIGHEQSGMEFKGPGPLSDPQLITQVVKAVLGMSNRRYGGQVIIGVRDDGETLEPVGLPDDEQRTWTFDAVSDGFKVRPWVEFARYADPGVTFELEVVELDGNNYILLQ